MAALARVPRAGRARCAAVRRLRPAHCAPRVLACAPGGSPAAEPVPLEAAGLRKEAERQRDRAVKKVSAARQRVSKAEDAVAALLADESASEEALLKAPDVGDLRLGLEEARARLASLDELIGLIGSVRKGAAPAEAHALALALGVGDSPPPKQPRGPNKKKTPAPGPRRPFFEYDSADGVVIRVGRQAEDNDRLSTDPELRDPEHWWMHARGCPGSHVVIRTTDEAPPAETVADAAALSARYSKAPQRGKVAVSLVRCRQVSKPRGAKPGLVHLSGDVRTVSVDVAAAGARLERLEATKR